MRKHTQIDRNFLDDPQLGWFDIWFAFIASRAVGSKHIVVSMLLFQAVCLPTMLRHSARMVISIWQISNQYNTAVFIWFSWVESIWHQLYLILSMSMIEAPRGNPECLQHMLMSDEKLQGMEFTQLLADQQEQLGGTWLERCSIWVSPKMVESPTKYPSQWGTDGKLWETDVWTVDLGASYFQTNHST